MRTPDAPSADAGRWNAVDTSFAGLLSPHDTPSREALASNATAGLPPHDGSALQGHRCRPNNPGHVGWALKLSRPGRVIVGDNVVRGGAVADPASTDPNVQGVHGFLDMIAAEPRLNATAIQTVGESGWDGFVLTRVGPPPWRADD